MKTWIIKRLKSKTIQVALLVIALGILELTTHFIKSPDIVGYVIIVIGILKWLLRELTTTSLNNK